MRSWLLVPLRGLLVTLLLLPAGALADDDGHVLPQARLEALAPLYKRVGPVPDYAPIDSVWTHPQLLTIAPDLAFSLTKYLGDRHRVETYMPPPADEADVGERDAPIEASVEDELEDGLASGETEDDTLVWMRDYQPIYVRRPDGGIKLLRYLHGNPNRSGYLPLGHPTADPFPPSRGREPDVSLEMLPLLHENGNLVVAGRWLLMTDLVVEDNALSDDQPHLLSGGFKARAPEEVIALLARRFGRSPDEFVILPRMPEEQTGHVDLFVMALSDTRVMVPEIRSEALGSGEPAVDEGLAAEVQRFLDEIAHRLAGLGLEVVRLPMLPPLLLASVEAEEPDDPVFYSPANGLLLRTPERSRVLIPTADLRDAAPKLAPLQRRYERHWSRVFRAEGWTPTRIDATTLARYLGLFRCVTQVVPAQ